MFLLKILRLSTLGTSRVSRPEAEGGVDHAITVGLDRRSLEGGMPIAR